MDSKLTTGGPYVTAEIRTSFKGYYRISWGKSVALMRSFVQFDGEGDTANARPRAIGGHPAVVMTGLCLREAPADPHADREGYVLFGKLVDYSAGRSNGCTTWSPSDSERILPLVKDRPTTLYIPPESTDIVAVARAVKTGRSPSRAGLYWNASCLREIRSPNFWPRETHRSSFNTRKIARSRQRSGHRFAGRSEVYFKSSRRACSARASAAPTLMRGIMPLMFISGLAPENVSPEECALLPIYLFSAFSEEPIEVL
jgi:hypothetical protein